MSAMQTRVGIEALHAYCGVAQIPVAAIFEGRRLDRARLDNLMMEKRSIALPCEDPVTNAVNAALPIVERLSAEARERIEILIVSTESGVDYSKSIASYVHDHLGLSRNCRLLEVKQACYAATAAIQLAAGYLASGISPGAKVLVIATDVALVDARAEYAEPSMGTGGAAVLLGEDPRIVALDLGAFGNYSYETMDSARPTPAHDIADVDGSLFAYLDCLAQSFRDYAARVDGADFVETFRFVAMHTPFAGLVKAAHRKMMRELKNAERDDIENDFERRVAPSLVYGRQVGNLCSGSVYLALSSVIDHAAAAGSSRVGLFSYGSGCSSEFFSGVIDRRSKETLAPLEIGAHLDGRCELAFGEYCALLEENLRCLTPVRERTIDLDASRRIADRARKRRRLLALQRIRGYHREYTWI